MHYLEFKSKKQLNILFLAIMKELSQDQLQVIEDCGSVDMPLDEVAEIAGCSELEISNNPLARKYYRRGQLRTKLKIRQANAKLAMEGQPQAIKIWNDMAKVVLPEIGPEVDDSVELGGLDGKDRSSCDTVAGVCDDIADVGEHGSDGGANIGISKRRGAKKR